jgi:hypothetical protein
MLNLLRRPWGGYSFQPALLGLYIPALEDAPAMIASLPCLPIA